ncbi:nitronate monooxygenase [Arthrobacter sp. MSA 4-2]|uniref:NAD(P)H-dependent flavin oxidoreductase n=1 Tax=Arthrobacter sp. MSA 4-2 TaxID=2794349 RepID=UPI0018E7197D|nr:nitronate monooxygenase family protein [Arthrobacter sp. MSA 4-2]MBJ2120430.1 nitronate monooxygenase [Arthrobacter sp. MSA 4-2]
MTLLRHTRVADLLGLDFPIIQGPFGGGLSSESLVAAVAEAGGLGSFGAHHLRPDEITALVGRLKDATARPFAVNLWIPLGGDSAAGVDQLVAQAALLAPYFEELGIDPPEPSVGAPIDFDAQLDALLAAAPPVISFVFGAPAADTVDRARRAGIRLVGTATTVDEAAALEEAGVDVIVASGSDAGGHRGAFLAPAEESLVGTFSLVPQIVAAVDTPVVAAGGIATPSQIRAAHELGAEGVQVGTAFLVADESAASAVHKQAVTGPAGRSTVLTGAFTGRLARGLVNRVTREASGWDTHVPYPALGAMTSPFRRAAEEEGRADLASFWAGQSAPLARLGPAAEIFASFAGAYD